jgi:hypothetical protein
MPQLFLESSRKIKGGTKKFFEKKMKKVKNKGTKQ